MRLLVGTSCVVALSSLLAVGGGHATRQLDDPVGRRTVVLGRSVAGRLITAFETGDLDSSRTALVVGCIHGNECSGIAVARRLARSTVPREVGLWVVPNLNPDGASAGTRGNARGVDLNRNFPWRWQPLHGIYYSGLHPLSERETRIASRLIEQVRPTVSIWFHQHLDLVDDSTGSIALERRFGTIAHMRLAPLAPEPGSAVTWQSHCFPHATSFVVELRAGPVTARDASRLTNAVRAAVAAATPVTPPAARVDCSG